MTYTDRKGCLHGSVEVVARVDGDGEQLKWGPATPESIKSKGSELKLTGSLVCELTPSGKKVFAKPN